MKHLIYIIIPLLAILLFPNCAHDHADDDGHQHEATSNEDEAMAHGSAADLMEVGLTHDQIKNIGLEFETIMPRKIKSIVKLNGRVELPPLGKAEVGSSLDGKITGIFTQPGKYVNKGQKLFTLENLAIIDWQQDLEKERAELEYLKNELARQKGLSDDAIAPVKNYESTLSKLRQSEAMIKGLEGKLNALGISHNLSGAYQSSFSIFAPSSGVVQHLSADMGSFISAGTPLAQIINNTNLHLHLSAFGGDISKLKEGQLINFFVHSRLDKIMEAKIFWINSIVDEESNSYDVHAEILNGNQDLISGEFVEARVINQEQTINTLPIEAVTTDKGLDYIFIKEEEHEDEVHFLKLQVHVGEHDLGYVEVMPIDPIPAGAEVVTKGAFFLMAQSKKGEEGAGGHSH